jgi:hypothetical protein
VRLRSRWIPVAAAASLLLAACNGEDITADDTVGTVEDEPTEEPVEDGVTEDDDAVDEDAATDPETEEAVAGLELATHEELGEHLVDDAGNTIYVNVAHDRVDDEAAPADDDAVEDEDASEDAGAEDAGPLRCEADCAQVWPAVHGDTDVELADGLDEQLLGTVERDDGSTQLTYDGWPLHAFVGDDTGDANGQGLGNTWFVIGPDGEALGSEDVPAADGDDAADTTEDE